MNLETDVLVIGGGTGNVWNLILRSVIWLLVFLLPTMAMAQEATDTPDGGLPRSDAGQILFVRDSAIYIINGDGSDEQNLLTTQDTFPLVAWLPDGNQWVVAHSYGIYLMQANGSDAQLLFQRSDRGIIYLLKPSPDGERLLFNINPDYASTRSFYVLEIATGELHPIAEDIENFAAISWFSNDEILVSHDHALYAFDFISGDERLLTEGGAGKISPDGTVSATFARNEETGMTTLNVHSLEGADINYTIEQDGLVYNVQWSPDGRYVGYVPHRLTEGIPVDTVQAIEVENGEVHILTPTYVRGEIEAFAWSPDSQQIAFTSRDVEGEASFVSLLYVISLEDKSIRWITQVTDLAISLEWRP